MLARHARLQAKLPPFGRRSPFRHPQAATVSADIASDAKLFLMTFAGGLIFMTVYLA